MRQFRKELNELKEENRKLRRMNRALADSIQRMIAKDESLLALVNTILDEMKEEARGYNFLQAFKEGFK